MPPIFAMIFGMMIEAFPLPAYTSLLEGASAKALAVKLGTESAAAPAAAVLKKSLRVDMVFLL